MKSLLFKILAIISVLAGTGFPVAAEDLDAALAAQKEKASRRVYSENALIEDRRLEVPHTATERELALDKKLREMDAAADKATPVLVVAPQRMSPVVRPAESKNWLTPAALDDAASANLPDRKEDDWLAQEVERQQSLRQQVSDENEAAQIEKKLLREKMQPQSTSPALDSLKPYQLNAPDILGRPDTRPEGSPYTTPQRGSPSPMDAIRPAPKKEPVEYPVFSPQAARVSQEQNKAAVLSPSLGSPVKNSPSSGFSSGLGQPETAPLSPVERIKRSSSIYREDPFSNDFMPERKSSIWD